MRGGLVRALKRLIWRRLIPASAGRTPAEDAQKPADGAHPRECGADRSSTRTVSTGKGSSPRVRGGHLPKGHHRRSAGLIPASAGRTTSVVSPLFLCGAHPRECGADPRSAIGCGAPFGSSPRVRGGLSGLRQNSGFTGLIPASAGRTHADERGSATHRAHPRECGADLIDYGLVWHPPGSSPRVRGGQIDRRPHGTYVRLIPASAGRTGVRTMCILVRWAHPRECGADGSYALADTQSDGSSPRVRGGHPTVAQGVGV